MFPTALLVGEPVDLHRFGRKDPSAKPGRCTPSWPNTDFHDERLSPDSMNPSPLSGPSPTAVDLIRSADHPVASGNHARHGGDFSGCWPPRLPGSEMGFAEGGDRVLYIDNGTIFGSAGPN
jgi:hypothetical protein